jgi:Flp pilus assembly protein TadG
MNTRRYKMQRAGRNGVTSVEFAIVSPIVFGIIWISFEFLRITMIQNLADVATYEAARSAIVPGAKLDEAVSEAQKYLRYMGTRSANISVQAFRGDDVQTEIDDFTSRVEVDVSIPVASNSLILSRFFGHTTIKSSHTSLSFESYSGYYDGL